MGHPGQVPKMGTLFTGFGLFDIGAQAAGLHHAWGVEHDPAIADVAAANSLDVITGDVRKTDFSALAPVYWLHASPPCTTASVANVNGGETDLDQELAAATIHALRALRPRRFSLENVSRYRDYTAFHTILRALADGGYAAAWWTLNAASYGVPQSRLRLILVASLDHLPRRPAATHGPGSRKTAEQPPLVEPLPPWRGWLPALRGEYGGRDLLPTLPPADLAAWQLKRMPKEWRTMLLANGKYGDALVYAGAEAPACTITANSNQTGVRAVLVSGRGMPPCDAKSDGVRVVRMTPAALARLQTVPDTYRLPERATLAVRGIGNGVPCDLARAIVEANR